MATIRMEDVGVVESAFMVVGSAYSGQFFIYIDPKHVAEEQLETIKRKLREARMDVVGFKNVQRYTAEEVGQFLEEAGRIL